MRRAFAILALLLLAAIPSHAQSVLCFDSTAMKVDNIPTQMAVASGGGGTCSTVYEVAVWRTSAGKFYFSIAPDSIRFTGTCDVVDGMSTQRIFDMLSTNAVSVGISRGYTLCPNECGFPTTTRVAVGECLQRTGTGASTRFTTCFGPQCCYREYNVCCSAGIGSPTITLTGRFGSGCPQSIPPCQSSCQ